MLVRWKPPKLGWVKLNVDGARKEEDRTAGCGGLIRNHKGEWIGGFEARIEEQGSITHVEIWKILKGMEMAWDLGMQRIIETDSKEFYDCINRAEEKGRYHNTLIRDILNLKNRSWKIKIQHTQSQEKKQMCQLASKGQLKIRHIFFILEHFPC
ncbi:hypothetical protein AHAS_Ahas08G0083600 [Arachis hypogaea]